MDWLTPTLTAVTALVVALTGLGAVLAKLWHRDNVTDGRVDLLWTAHLRRGQVEGKAMGYFQQTAAPNTCAETPPLLRLDVRAAYEPIAPALRQLYAKVGRTEGDVAFIEAVERQYGDWLLKHICEPLAVHQYACLEMARLVAKESATTPAHLDYGEDR